MTPSEIAARPAILDDLVSKEVHPDDGMLQMKTAQHVAHYFACGRDAVSKIAGILTTAQVGTPSSVLDFGCGHGRVARYIRAAFPDSRMFVSDIKRGAVDYCRDAFSATPVYSAPDFDAVKLPEPVSLIWSGTPGCSCSDIKRGAVDYCRDAFSATPVYSAPDFDAVRLPEPVSLIWSGSLLTHLAEHKAKQMLQMFHRSLLPGGVAVFTCHGRHSANFWTAGKWPYNITDTQMKALYDDYVRHDYGFAGQGNSQDYGISVTPVSWIMDQLKLLPGFSLISYFERGWDNHQDIVAIRRDMPR